MKKRVFSQENVFFKTQKFQIQCQIEILNIKFYFKKKEEKSKGKKALIQLSLISIY